MTLGVGWSTDQGGGNAREGNRFVACGLPSPQSPKFSHLVRVVFPRACVTLSPCTALCNPTGSYWRPVTGDGNHACGGLIGQLRRVSSECIMEVKDLFVMNCFRPHREIHPLVSGRCPFSQKASHLVHHILATRVTLTTKDETDPLTFV